MDFTDLIAEKNLEVKKEKNIFLLLFQILSN